MLNWAWNYPARKGKNANILREGRQTVFITETYNILSLHVCEESYEQGSHRLEKYLNWEGFLK